jgi:hypothetical protein
LPQIAEYFEENHRRATTNNSRYDALCCTSTKGNGIRTHLLQMHQPVEHKYFSITVYERINTGRGAIDIKNSPITTSASRASRRTQKQTFV